MELPKVLKYKTRRGGGGGRRRQRTRHPVSRSSAHGAFEDKRARKGVRGSPKCSARPEAKRTRRSQLPPPGTAQKGAPGVTGPQRSPREERRREGRDGSPRLAPHPARATLQQPDVLCRDPGAAPGRRQLRALPGCRPDHSPPPPERPQAPEGHSPGAISGELTAPPTKTAAARTADPRSPRGAIAAFLRPSSPERRVRGSCRQCSLRAGG